MDSTELSRSTPQLQDRGMRATCLRSGSTFLEQWKGRRRKEGWVQRPKGQMEVIGGKDDN